MITLARRVADVRGSAIRDLLTLTARPEVISLAGGLPAADLGAIADAITGLSRLACDLGDALEALDINPLICAPAGPVAVDALLIPRPPA